MTIDATHHQPEFSSEGWMLAPAVAKRFGIQTGTLKKWRQQGKGPRGWKRIAPTVVVYPVDEVQKFDAKWRDTPKPN